MCCNCGTVTVFCTSTPATVVDTTGMSTTWSEKKRAATVGSRLSPTLSAHRGPAQQTSITLSMYCNCRISGKTDHGNLRLRHDRDVDDLDMHNNGHVNPVHNAQFETVRTCLCCITAIPSSVEELKRGTIHCPTKTAGTCHAWAQRRHLCPVFVYRPGPAVSLHPVSCTFIPHVCPAARQTAMLDAPSMCLTKTKSNPSTSTNCSAVCG